MEEARGGQESGKGPVEWKVLESSAGDSRKELSGYLGFPTEEDP